MTMLKFISRAILLISVIICLLFQSAILLSEGDCEECDNPLVEVKNCDFEGDMPDFDEWSGWNEIGTGEADIGSQLSRGMEVFGRFVNRNPCADFYYTMNPPGMPIRKIGLKEGKAKFEIRSTATIHKCTNNETTVVRHIIEEQIPLDPPRMSPQGNLISFDVNTIYDGYVQVFVKHELVALKNGTVYDTGSDLLDWIDSSPDPNGNYFYCEDANIDVDGYTLLPNDGIIVGGTSPMTIASTNIHFDRGDVGVTIRKKEAPSRCKVNVDDQEKSRHITN